MEFWDEFASEVLSLVQKSKEFGLNVATAGGHHKLKNAIENYKSCYSDYEGSKALYEQAAVFLRDSRASVDSRVKESVELLTDARDMVERVSWNARSSNLPEHSDIEVPSLHTVDRVLSDINTAMESARGTGFGAAAGAGAWLLVAHLGAASTGAAISGLAGAASTNAILAWFGGGALTAGGGGMALGGAVLGGLAVIPAIAYGAFRSYKEANRLVNETHRVTEASSTNKQNASKMREMSKRVDSLQVWICDRNTTFSNQLQAFRERSLKMAAELAAIANAFAEELSCQTEKTSSS